MSNIIEAGRSLEQVTNGIRILTAQTAANMCQLGKLLIEAKAMVGHGGWKEYLEKEVSYSQSTANNFMRLYEAYGEFGPNPQTFGNLGASKALELLALPEGKREEFAETHDVESMSVRELKAQIAAEKERAEKAETVTAALREQLAVAQEEIGAVRQKAADWQQQAQEAAEQGDAQKTLISVVQDAVGQVGEKLNVLQGHYIKVKATNPKLAEAIRSLVSRQIYLMYERFDIEPV